jgi:hypothetical protein
MPVEMNKKQDGKAPKPRRFGSSLLSLLATLFLVNFLVVNFLRPGPTRVAYSDFLRQVRSGRVGQVLIGDNEIRYTLRESENAADSTPEAASPVPEASPSPAPEASPSPVPAPEVASPAPAPASPEAASRPPMIVIRSAPKFFPPFPLLTTPAIW